MLHCGWEVQDLDRNNFFSKGDEKEFTILTPGAGSFHRSYLQVLLQCDWLFEAGISSIFHCQSKAYYDCILSLAKMGAAENLKNLKPHRRAAEYKQMVKMQQEPGGGKANRSKGTDLLQEEEEPNFFGRPQEPQGDAQRQLAHQNHSQTSKTRRKNREQQLQLQLLQAQEPSQFLAQSAMPVMNKMARLQCKKGQTYHLEQLQVLAIF